MTALAVPGNKADSSRAARKTGIYDTILLHSRAIGATLPCVAQPLAAGLPACRPNPIGSWTRRMLIAHRKLQVLRAPLLALVSSGGAVMLSLFKLISKAEKVVMRSISR